MRQGHASPEARVGATTLAVTAAAVAILEVLQRTTDSFDPRPAISTLIVAAVFFATLALTVLRHRMARDRELDDALRAWPLPSLARADPYRLGVFPPRSRAISGESEYVPRERVDKALEKALGASDRAFILITGPRGAGKSRTALQGARTAMPDALVVVPEDAQGLRALLDLDPPLFSRRSRLPNWPRSASAVLWLDGLNRFMDEIDADLLDDVRASAIPVSIVATIRDEEYETALEGSGAEAEGAKAVAAAAQEFELPDQRPTGARVVGQGQHASAAVAPGERVIHAPIRDPFFTGPAALSIASLVAILLIIVTSGFSEPTPPSLAERADEELRAAGGEVVWGPEQADLHGSGQASYLFAFDPEGSGSHEIRIYDEHGGDLVEAFSFQPDVDDAEFQFRALSEIGGGGAKLIGGYGFPARQSLALLPFVIRWDPIEGEYAIEGLQDEPPAPSDGVDPEPDARDYLDGYRERITFSDGESGLSISGYRVQDFAIQEDPDRLVSAIAVDPRTASEPGLVEVRGSILSVSGPHPTVIGCRFPDDPPLLGSWSPGRLLYFELLDSWEPFIKNRVCEPDL